MRSIAKPWRRSIISFSFSLGIVGLIIPFAIAQSRPAPAAQGNIRERLTAKITMLSQLIEKQIEARRQLERAESALAITQDAAAGGKELATMNPALKQDAYQINQLEIERDLMLENTGSENVRYKAIAKRVKMMKAANARYVEMLKTTVAENLEAARAEVAAAQTKLEIANAQTDAAKSELVDLAAGGK